MKIQKVLLICPNFITTTSKIFQFAHKFFPPSNYVYLGIAYIASMLEKEGFEVKIIDATQENLNMKQLLKKIKLIKPDVIGITSNVTNARAAILTGILCKNKYIRAKIVMGGPWATINWKYIIKNNYADFVVIGEGERTIIELISKINNPDVDYKTIRGIAYKDKENMLIKTQNRAHIEDIDNLPYPAWHLYTNPMDYNFPFKGKKAYPIITSRGCPYGCYFCTKYVHGYKMRYRSPVSIISEIKYLKEKYNVDEIFIVDDNFTMDISRANKILDLMIREKLKLKITFSNGIRADTLSPKLLIKMKKAGVKEFAIGIESGNQHIVDKIGKKLSLQKIKEIAPFIKKLDFIFKGFFIIGHPYDTPNTMQDTIEFAKEIKLDIAQFSKATPWPGTKLYNLIHEKGEFRKNMDTIDSFNLYASQFQIWHMNPGLMNKYFILAHLSFYFRWKWFRSFFSKIKTYKQLFFYLSNIILMSMRMVFD